MEERERIRKLIQEADISELDWEYDIIHSIENKYVRGYFNAKYSELNEVFDTCSENFRQGLLEVCDYDIWNED